MKLNRSLFKNVLRSHKPFKYYVLLIGIVNNITYLFWWFFVQHYFIFRQIVILQTFWILFWKIIFERYLIEQAKCQLFLKFKALSTTNQRKCMRASSQYRFLLSNLKRKNRAKFSFLFFFRNLISKIYYASYWVTY